MSNVKGKPDGGPPTLLVCEGESVMSTLRAQRKLRSRLTWRVAAWVLPALLMGSLAIYAWNSSLWPGRQEATTTPQACDVVNDARIQTLVAEPANGSSDAPGRTSVCSWESPENNFPWQTLTVRITRESRSLATSASSRAASSMQARRAAPGASRSDGGTFQPIDGVGDDAWARIRSDRSSTDAQVLARRANVWVHVDYDVVRLTPDGVDNDDVRARLIAVAMDALSQVRLN